MKEWGKTLLVELVAAALNAIADRLKQRREQHAEAVRKKRSIDERHVERRHGR